MLKHKRLTFIFGVMGGMFLSAIVSIADAGVYRCVDASGEISFQDKSCESNASAVDFLPYVYEIKEKEDFKPVKNKTLERPSAKQEEIKLKRQTKQLEKEKMLRERKKLRCENTRRKIKEIESHFRAGCSVKRSNRLKKELMHRREMEKRYCER